MCPNVLNPDLFSPGIIVGLQLMRVGQLYPISRVALPTLSSIGAVGQHSCQSLWFAGDCAGFGMCAGWAGFTFELSVYSIYSCLNELTGLEVAIFAD